MKDSEISSGFNLNAKTVFHIFYCLVANVAASRKKRPEKKEAADSLEDVEMVDVQSAEGQKDGDAPQEAANIPS